MSLILGHSCLKFGLQGYIQEPLAHPHIGVFLEVFSFFIK